MIKKVSTSLLYRFSLRVLVCCSLLLASCKSGDDGFSFVEDGSDNESVVGPAEIQSSSPSAASVVQCVSANVRCGTSPVLTNGSTLDYTVSVNGTAPISYVWRLDGTIISGATSSIYTLTTTPATVLAGTYVLSVTASNSEGSDVHSWTVKVNEPPELGVATPDNTSTIGANYASLLSLDMLASDANSDAITYVWQLDGAASGTLSGSAIAGGSRGVYSPNSSHVGDRVVKVVARDAHYTETGAGKYEPEEYEWNVNVNYLSTACNELSAGGICTVAGRPGLMTDTDSDGYYSATTEPIKIKPNFMADDGSGNLFISDSGSHVIWFHNRSGAMVTRLGKDIEPGKVRILVGNGSAGKSDDLSASYENENYKLNGPQMMYYDSGDDYLYIADFYNHRVVRINSDGQGLRVFGTEGVTNTIATNNTGLAARDHFCAFPAGLAVNSAEDTMFVSCSGNNTTTSSVIKEIDMTDPDPLNWTAQIVVGRTVAVTGTTAAGAADGISGVNIDPRAPAGTSGNQAANLITDPGHPYAENDRLNIISITGGGGLTAATGIAYYARNVVAGTSYQLSLTPGGLVIDFTTNITALTIAKVVNINVTGDQATNTITQTAHPFVDNEAVMFAGITGGAGFSTSTMYYIRNATANTYQLSTTVLGTPVDFTTNITQAGIMQMPASINHPWALALDQYENLYFTELNQSGRVRVLKRNASPASYFNGTVTTAKTGVTYTLFGANNTTPSNAATDGTRAASGFRDGRGLAILENGANIDGFFISNGLHSTILFANNSSGILTYGGNAINTASPVGLVWGVHDDPDNASVVTPATNNRLFRQSGLLLQGGSLLVADTLNFQVRALNLTTGAVSTVTGGVANKHRAKTESVVAEAPNSTEMYQVHHLLYDSSGTNNRILIADNSSIGASWNVHDLIATPNSASFNPNYRIRQLNLTTGQLSTLLGGGYGNADTSPQAPTSAMIQGLRGMALTSNGTLLYVDRYQFGGTTNRNCMVRAYNLSGTTQSYFGVNAVANFVTTIFGNYALGCNTFSPTTGTAAQISNPEGIAISGTDLYVSEYSRHCILKLDNSNNATVAIGSCGTANSTNGNFATARFQFPKQLLQDPRFPTNFFVLDQTNQTTSLIRYVNLSGSDCSAGLNPCGVNNVNTENNFVRSPISIAGGYGSAMAYYMDPVSINDDLICFASSESHNTATGIVFGNTSYGSNNVICRYRKSGSVSITIGPQDNSTLSGGSQIDDEEEGQVATCAAVAPDVCPDDEPFELNVKLDGPSGLAFDSEGNLYISEKNSHTIRKVKKWW